MLCSVSPAPALALLLMPLPSSVLTTGKIPCDLDLGSAVSAHGRLRILVDFFFLACRGELVSSHIHWIYWKSVPAECVYSPMLLAVLLTGAERRFIETANIC